MRKPSSGPVRFSTQKMIEKLVAFNTISARSNLELIAFIEEYLSGWGVSSRRIPDQSGTKSSLFATLGPPDRTGGIVLSGHTDVVPVEGQDWSRDPFTLTEKDGKLFGRGTCDMKSFIALALARVPDFLERGLAIPVHLAFSYDEEVGCLGVRDMIAHILPTIPRPEVVIVGEPTEMKVVNAHKSIHAFMTEVTGLEAHSSAVDKGVNAIVHAAGLVRHLHTIQEELVARGDPSGRFDPPFTSIQIGRIEGGTALNIIPRHCRFLWEFRALPTHDCAEIPGRLEDYAQTVLLPSMRKIFPGADIRTQSQSTVPPLQPEEGSPAETLVLQLAEHNKTHAVSYGTEAGFFQQAGIPTVICGPGNILQAHKTDEFITLHQVALAERFFDRLGAHVCH